MIDHKPLKLRARDIGDMDVVAACLQDSLIPVIDMTFQPRQGRFVMVANRFMWEHGSAEPPTEPVASGLVAAGADAAYEDSEPRVHGYRVNCGVAFDRVRAVRTKGIDQADKEHILNLLTVSTEPDAITFLFSDSAAIWLEVSDIRCQLEDLGEPWPTWSLPDHAPADEPPPDPAPQDPAPQDPGPQDPGPQDPGLDEPDRAG
jgi:hypothetical protein